MQELQNVRNLHFLMEIEQKKKPMTMPERERQRKMRRNKRKHMHTHIYTLINSKSALNRRAYASKPTSKQASK